MLRVTAERWLLRLWFPGERPSLPTRLVLTGLWLVLLPLSWLTEWIAVRRRVGLLAQRSLGLGQRPAKKTAGGSRPAGHPVIVVVGNLVVGGAGKTPVTIALARALTQRGLRVGLLGHAYRAQSPGPMRVDAATAAEQAGDEAVLLALETRDLALPVAAGRDRAAAIALLLELQPELEVVICDDGLQHTALRRDIELAVFDSRGVGNGALLPAGPLREPLAHTAQMDALLLNGGTTPIPHPRAVAFSVQPRAVVRIDRFLAGFAEQASTEADDWRQVPLARTRAFAGLADPSRFERTLAELGVTCFVQPLGDHGQFVPGQLNAIDADLILVTAKDAVKLRNVNDLRIHVVLVAARFPDEFLTWLERRIHECRNA